MARAREEMVQKNSHVTQGLFKHFFGQAKNIVYFFGAALITNFQTVLSCESERGGGVVGVDRSGKTR